MGKKTVVLCEGVHDLALLSLILEDAGIRFWSKQWDQIKEYSKYTPETTLISEFKGRKGRGFSVLLKQDKDVDFCIESFWGLYEGYDGYDLKLVTDFDGDSTLRKIRRMMDESIHRDVLVQGTDEEENVFFFKGFGSVKKPAVFLYPKVDEMKSGKLTDIVKEAGCGNLAGCRDADERQEIIRRYLETKPEWVEGLKRFLVE